MDELGLEAADVVGVGEAGRQLGGGGGELDAVADLTGPDRDAGRQCVLPVPGGPRNSKLPRTVTKSRVPRWAMMSRLKLRA